MSNNHKRRPYDKAFSPKAVLKKVANLADSQGHAIGVLGKPTRHAGRVDQVPVQCEICAQVGVVKIDHSRGKIIMQDFSPVDDRCLTDAELTNVLDDGHTYVLVKDLPTCSDCGHIKNPLGDNNPCMTHHEWEDHSEPRPDDAPEVGHEWNDVVAKCKNCGRTATQEQKDEVTNLCSRAEWNYHRVQTHREREGGSIQTPGSIRRLTIMKATGTNISENVVKEVMEAYGGEVVKDDSDEPDET